MGGELEVCLEAFTYARLTIEDQEDDNDKTSDDPYSSSDGDYTSSDGMNIDTQAQSFRVDRNVDPQVFEQQTNNTQKRVSLSPEPSQLYNNTMVIKEPPKKKKHPGRHGDIRMRREWKLDKRIRIYLYFQPYWQADLYQKKSSLRYTHRG